MQEPTYCFEEEPMESTEQPTIQYYWEDLPVGTVLELGSVTVDRDEALAFARRYDPQPFHVDDAAAAHSWFGRLAASGWQTCAMAMGLYVRHFTLRSASMGSPGVEQIKWLKPVYPGDVLTLRQRVVDARPMRSRPGVGLVRGVMEMFNQQGEQVLMIDAWGMFGRRTPADGAAKTTDQATTR
jgi:acyl dehydratase